MKNLRTFFACAIAAVLAAPLTAVAAQPVKILFNSFGQRQLLMVKDVILPWLDDITKATDGRVVFEVPPTSLNAPQQQYDGVLKGIYDAAYMYNGLLVDRVKLVQVAQLPFVSTKPSANSVALWETYTKYFAKADEYKDVHLLGLFVIPPAELFSLNKPYESVNDLKGQKIFSIPGSAAQVMDAAGAAIVAGPAVRSYEAISGGTVDGFTGYSAVDAEAVKTLQFAKYITDIDGYLTAPSFSVFISKKKWDSIPKQDQDIITRMSGVEFAKRFKAYDPAVAKRREDNLKEGIKYITASKSFNDDLKRLGAPIQEAWIAEANKLGVNGREALDFYRKESGIQP